MNTRTSGFLSVACLIVLGLNLRPALSSVAPVLASIQHDLELSSAAVGILTTLPVVCFGVFAPGAARLAARFTVNRVILYGLLALVLGLCMRIFLGAPGLFFGTAVAGAGISAVMVLLPSVIKREFSSEVGRMTGLYTMTVCLGAAFASGVTVPIQSIAQGDWRPALAAWAIPAALAAWLWHYASRRPSTDKVVPQRKGSGIYANALAWQVTLYMGLQSAIAFIIFGWLPVILIDRKMSALDSGYVMSVVFACQIFTALTAPSLASRGRDQRFAACIMLALTVVGMLGVVYAPIPGVWLWAVTVGLGMGGNFSIALALIVWRSPNPEVATALSGMAQGAGYAVAAMGPLTVGILHEWTHDWSFLGGLMLAIAAATFASAMGAGRNITIKLGQAGQAGAARKAGHPPGP